MSLKSMKSALGAALVNGLDAAFWYPYRKSCPRIRAALKIMPLNQLVYAVNISRRHRYVYMDNPKTGCSSLKSALTQLEARTLDRAVDHYDWRIFHDRSVSLLTRLDDWRHPASLTVLQNQGYRFITMVRNPYTRLLSCYRDKILGNGQQKREILAALGRGGEPLEAPVSFAEFVGAVAGQSDYEMNPHWRTQTSHVLYGIVEYAYIGRFEQYERDFVECFRVLGIPDSEIPESRHLNRTKAGPAEHCGEFYTDEIREQVYRRYRADFEQFGYPAELPV